MSFYAVISIGSINSSKKAGKCAQNGTDCLYFSSHSDSKWRQATKSADLLSVSVTLCRKFDSFKTPNKRTTTNFLASTTNYFKAYTNESEKKLTKKDNQILINKGVEIKIMENIDAFHTATKNIQTPPKNIRNYNASHVDSKRDWEQYLDGNWKQERHPWER